tara:strand:- start:1170 stop:1610 length:441 start_codon:yes stop_codon:yes gene_type:complete
MSTKKKIKPPAPRGRPTVDTGGSDYASWLMLVPKDKRREVAEFISEHPIKEFDDLVTFSCKIMAALMEGRITPVVAKELRAWHELNFTILATKNTALGSPQDAYTDVVTALVAVQRERKQIRGDYFEVPELEEEREPVKVEAKGGK